MKNKGFTLIELLSVIVILAIIALIATPIILNIINDSKEESNKRSVELYGSAVEQAIAKSQLNGSEIPVGDLSSTFLETVQYSGSKVTCTTNKLYEDGSIYLAGCNGNYTYGVSQEDKYAYMWYTGTDVSGPSIGGDASSLATSAPTDKDNYLKFKLDSDNKVTESYACGVYGDSRKEACLRGGSPDFYGYAGTGEYDEYGSEILDYEKLTGNALILKGLESEVINCNFGGGYSDCYVASVHLFASSDGSVSAVWKDGDCSVDDDGSSYCVSY